MGVHSAHKEVSTFTQLLEKASKQTDTSLIDVLSGRWGHDRISFSQVKTDLSALKGVCEKLKLLNLNTLDPKQWDDLSSDLSKLINYLDQIGVPNRNKTAFSDNQPAVQPKLFQLEEEEQLIFDQLWLELYKLHKELSLSLKGNR